MWLDIKSSLHFLYERRWRVLLGTISILIVVQFIASLSWMKGYYVPKDIVKFFEAKRLFLPRVRGQKQPNVIQTTTVSRIFVNRTSSRNLSSLPPSTLMNKLHTTATLPPCPLIPKGLVGPIAPNMTEEIDFLSLENKFHVVNVPELMYCFSRGETWHMWPVGPIAPNMTEEIDFLSLENKFRELEPGGRYKPPDCVSRHKVAIVIPYRNREKHLKIFLNNMHPFLQKQQLNYGIFIVEQKIGSTFNRALLMNIGFVEAMKQYDYQCFVFHDVDLLPEDDRNIYSCPDQPRHLSVAIDRLAYRLPYPDIFGGAVVMKTEHIKKVNGFSNKFWGWGGEDDDMSSRIRSCKLKITRYPVNIARYKMASHDRDKGNAVNPRRFDLMRRGLNRFHLDGLNTLKYKLLSLEKKKLYTRIHVELNEKS